MNKLMGSSITRLCRVQRQRGIALITALTITAIAVTITSLMIYRQQYSIQLSGNLAHREQAYQYITGMEQWASLILSRDKQDSETDHLGEDWAQGQLLPPTTIPGGEMSAYLEDLQSRVNINNLIITEVSNGETMTKVHGYWQQTLSQLTQTIGMNESVSDVILDWIDSDQNTSSNGAESDFYLSLDKPHFAADNAMTSPSELRILKPVDQELFQRLNPFITTLANTTPVNINTASKEVLQALGFKGNVVQSIIQQREDAEFTSVDDALTLVTDEQDRDSVDKEALSVTSQYFLLRGTIRIDQVRLAFNTVLFRNEQGQVNPISREFDNVYPELPKQENSEETTLDNANSNAG